MSIIEHYYEALGVMSELFTYIFDGIADRFKVRCLERPPGWPCPFSSKHLNPLPPLRTSRYAHRAPLRWIAGPRGRIGFLLSSSLPAHYLHICSSHSFIQFLFAPFFVLARARGHFPAVSFRAHQGAFRLPGCPRPAASSAHTQARHPHRDPFFSKPTAKTVPTADAPHHVQGGH